MARAEIDAGLARRRDADGDALGRSGLKLNHLRMILALEEHGQVSAAASVLSISQPAASRMIADMEKLLGASLCERLPRGVTLTPYGRALARRARSVLLELREVDREIDELRAGKGGSVFLGAVTSPAIELVIPAIKIVRQQLPKIEINMQIETSSVLAKELLASRHDFIIARIPDDLNPRLFETRVIGVEKACLIVRHGHPLLAQESVRLDELHGFDWVLQPSGSLLRRTMEGIFLSHNAPLPDRILNTSSLLLTLVMVAQTDAIAAVSVEVATFLTGRGEPGGSIGILPIEFEIIVQPYSLITVRNRSLSPTAQILYDHIRNQIR